MILYETKYLSLCAAKRENSPDWVYAKRPNASDIAVILPYIKQDDTLLFLITKRPPLIAENVAQYCVETPAGLVGDENANETLDEAFKKELLEETGHVASRFIPCVSKMSSSSGMTCEVSTIRIAVIEDKTLKQAPIDDGGVIYKRVYVKKDKVMDFLNDCSKKGYAISSQTLSALFYFFNLEI